VQGIVRSPDAQLPGVGAVGGHAEAVAVAAEVEAGRLSGAVGARDHHGAFGSVGECVDAQFDAVGPGGDRVLVPPQALAGAGAGLDDGGLLAAGGVGGVELPLRIPAPIISSNASSKPGWLGCLPRSRCSGARRASRRAA
jgi:hypothetical protein